MQRVLIVLPAFLGITACQSLPDIEEVNRMRVGLAMGVDQLDTDFTQNSTGALQASSEDTQIEIDLSAGYRLHDHVELGGVLQADYLDSEFDGAATSTSESRAIRVGPNARIYFVSTGAVQPWADVAVGLNYLDLEAGGVSDSGTGFAIEGGVGLSAFVSRWVAFEGAFRVGGSSVELDDFDQEIDTTRVAFTLGLSVFF